MTKLRILTSWVEISEKAYAHNLNFFKSRLSPDTEFSVVVKSNAYGHGFLEIASLAIKYGADSFCVHSLDEAICLRKSGYNQEILIMGPVLLDRLPEVLENRFRLVLYNLEAIDKLKKLTDKNGRTVKLHLKLETGTYRQGIEEKSLPVFLKKLNQNPRLQLDGVYTHFANIEDTTNHEYAFRQLDLFTRMAKIVKNEGFADVKLHAACSAAVLLFPETHFDMVRLGISQYGLWPSRETFVSYKIKHSANGIDVLQPVLSWKARIGQIKPVPPSQNIGYGGTYQTTRESRLAILPIGYADGYDRGLSNQSYVLINGQRAPMRGRVCMNLIMVDITDIPEVNLEDEVILLGKSGNSRISADQLANLCGTINYEFVTRIGPSIPRIITE
ncbi:MAG: alanine racemase [Calditrichaeota bacterium]|nr:alanine racemase [Calditrichota bacterium]RQW04525.1 MAG: alanine racemase [Calditrichota bacterium]